MSSKITFPKRNEYRLLIMCFVGFLPFLGIFFKSAYKLPGITPSFLVIFYACFTIGAYFAAKKIQKAFQAFDEKHAIRFTMVFFIVAILLLALYFILLNGLAINGFLFPIIATGDLKQAIGEHSYTDYLSSQSNQAIVKALLDKNIWVLYTKFVMVSLMAFSIFSLVFSLALGGSRVFPGQTSALQAADVI